MTCHASTCPDQTSNNIGETYDGVPDRQLSLLAGLAASFASVVLFLTIGAMALPPAAFA
jgi:hypothetical protein